MVKFKLTPQKLFMPRRLKAEQERCWGIKNMMKLAKELG